MPAIRTIEFERDATTDARSVLDIREFDAPASPLPRTWTELARDKDRRALVLDLLRQIDGIMDGSIDEIHILRRD